jgi:uncharacterized cofD-like protein
MTNLKLRPASSRGTPVAGPGLRVVAIGGGTGLSILLKGLKHYVAPPVERFAGTAYPTVSRDVTIGELCAVVTVSDDGGSSGRLRKELNMLPPGDIRSCIVALSEDEALLSRLFNHRFVRGSGLAGHSFGNLFLAALTSITKDFGEAVRLSSEILLTRGHIYPSTTSNIELEAVMENGTRVRGETKITASKNKIKELFLVPPDVEPLPQTLDAIARADLITIGPGSLFTSLIPNLLVHGIAQAIVNSAAVKVYVCNLMTQANESLGLTASDHVRAVYDHAEARVFDYALINRTPASRELQSKYAFEGAAQIEADLEAIEALGVCPVLGDYLDEHELVARHATDRVARDLLSLVSPSPVGRVSVNPRPGQAPGD